MYNPVMFSLPNAGAIAVIGRQYDTLSDDFIQQWMCELVNEHYVSPDYLLLSASARHDLYRIVMNDLHMYRWVIDYAQNDTEERAERYPNKATGGLLTLVVFPGLPEKTLFAASALKIVDEQVKVSGSVRTVTRTYGPQKEQ